MKSREADNILKIGYLLILALRNSPKLFPDDLFDNQAVWLMIEERENKIIECSGKADKPRGIFAS